MQFYIKLFHLLKKYSILSVHSILLTTSMSKMKFVLFCISYHHQLWFITIQKSIDLCSYSNQGIYSTWASSIHGQFIGNVCWYIHILLNLKLSNLSVHVFHHQNYLSKHLLSYFKLSLHLSSKSNLFYCLMIYIFITIPK